MKAKVLSIAPSSEKGGGKKPLLTNAKFFSVIWTGDEVDAADATMPENKKLILSKEVVKTLDNRKFLFKEAKENFK